ncbi:MAG: sulfotransferase [Chloroflexota bacterium]|nr:sulfotransferase [Chloroflexota bacterium]
MSDFIHHPIFVCGHPKAGTSLITALFDGHPNILVYPEETLFFRRFLPAIRGKTCKQQIDLAKKLLIQMFEWNQENPPEHQKNYPDRDYSHISFEEVSRLLVEFLPSQNLETYEFLNASVLAFGHAANLLDPNQQYWLEKTPYNELYTDKIFNWWPEAKCIHIIRDPRDNFVSYQRKHPDWTAKIFINNWVRSSRVGLKNLEKFGGEKYYLVRFEDLLTNPEEITGKIAQFLRITWDQSLLTPTRVGDGWQGNSMFAEKFHSISTAPIGRWKEHLDFFELELIQSISENIMRAFEYDAVHIENKDLSWTQRIILWREKFLSKLKRF